MAKKIFWTGMLAMALAFGMAVVGCDDGSTDGEADTALNGTWIIEDGEMKFNNGNFEFLTNGTPFQKGTYTTSGDKMTITNTHFNFSETGTNWYNKAQLLAEAESAEKKAEIEEMFAPRTIRYSVNGNKLTVIYGEESVTYTRK